MNIKIMISVATIAEISHLPGIIGAIVKITIPGDTEISGEITEIIADDGTIIDRESIIIQGTAINGGASTINGSIAREGTAPRGSPIRSEKA